MPANVEQPRCDDKPATPFEHGSIGKMPPYMLPASCLQFIRSEATRFHGSIGENWADVVCGTRLGESGPERKPCPPLAWRWWKRIFFTLGPQ